MRETSNNQHIKVDLLLALDTSGSVFPTFGRQRQLAVDLISALNPTPQQQQLRFGLISFAAQPAVVLPLVEGSDRQLVLDRLRTIEFTGGSTRIAEAAELALAELAKFGRAEALKVGWLNGWIRKSIHESFSRFWC